MNKNWYATPRRKDVGKKSDKHDCIVVLIVVRRRYDDKIVSLEKTTSLRTTRAIDQIGEYVGWIDLQPCCRIELKNRFLEKFHSNSKEEAGGRGINIAPEFKLDELIDVAETRGCARRPTSWPTCASSIVDFNSTVVASNANYLTSARTSSDEIAIVRWYHERGRQTSCPYPFPLRSAEIFDHRSNRGMNADFVLIAHVKLQSRNGICKLVSTIHESMSISCLLRIVTLIRRNVAISLWATSGSSNVRFFILGKKWSRFGVYSSLKE